MLRKIFKKNKCDKGSKHSYELVYEKDFELIKNEKINILEVGIFKGESTASWIEYFPNATVYGIDIFKRVKEADIEILSHPRVKHLKADSIQSKIVSIIKTNWPDIKFDIIIDDGLHTPLANKETFLNLIDFLKINGVFYIEDVWPLNEMTDKEMNNPWILKHPQDYTKENMNKFLDSIKGYNLEIFDNRKISKEPDSVIYKITK